MHIRCVCKVCATLDEERKQFKKSCETKEKLEAQVQIAEKHLLFAHEKKKMLELSIQSSTLESASSMTSGVESMDEQSELYEDRKAELEAMDTFTGQIEPFGKCPILMQYNNYHLFTQISVVLRY